MNSFKVFRNAAIFAAFLEGAMTLENEADSPIFKPRKLSKNNPRNCPPPQCPALEDKLDLIDTKLDKLTVIEEKLATSFNQHVELFFQNSQKDMTVQYLEHIAEKFDLDTETLAAAENQIHHHFNELEQETFEAMILAADAGTTAAAIATSGRFCPGIPDDTTPSSDCQRDIKSFGVNILATIFNLLGVPAEASTTLGTNLINMIGVENIEDILHAVANDHFTVDDLPEGHDHEQLRMLAHGLVVIMREVADRYTLSDLIHIVGCSLTWWQMAAVGAQMPVHGAVMMTGVGALHYVSARLLIARPFIVESIRSALNIGPDCAENGVAEVSF